MNTKLNTLKASYDGLAGTYDGTTHTYRLFLTVYGQTQRTWSEQAAKVRRDATMRPATIGGYVRDNDAPRLERHPLHACLFDEGRNAFVPVVNITATEAEWDEACNDARHLAGAAQLFAEQHGKLPGRGDVDGLVIYPAGDHVTQGIMQGVHRASVFDDLAARFNG